MAYVLTIPSLCKVWIDKQHLNTHSLEGVLPSPPFKVHSLDNWRLGGMCIRHSYKLAIIHIKGIQFIVGWKLRKYLI